jgi:23S rRNA (cytidine1920-2'-O)/16S rRNA (cytidine1409-2'-O)-methyltransferase
VREPSSRVGAVRRVADAAYALGWGTRAVVASPLPGPAGNVEYFLWLRQDGGVLTAEAAAAAVEAGPQ